MPKVRIKLKKKIEGIAKQKLLIEKELVSQIRKLKDNPNVTRLAKNIFIINFSELDKGRSLDPRYYDYKWQYEEIIQALQVSNMERMYNIMEDIVNNREPFSSKSGRGTHNIRIHPDVRCNIQKIWNGE